MSNENVKKEKKVLLLSGEVNWTSLNKPSKKYPTKYSCQFVPDSKSLKTLYENKVTVTLKTINEGKEDETIIKYVTPSTFVFKQGGVEKNKLPLVVDKYNRVITSDIGNGSKVNIKVTTRPYPSVNGGKAGVAVDFVAMQVLELVEYVAPEEIDKTEGFAFEEPPEDLDLDETVKF